MWRKILPAAAIAAAFTTAGCTGSENGADWSEPFPGRTPLHVVDSIGTEAGGDSNFVFGSIAGVTHSRDGGVVVLDMVRCCILAYTDEGEFTGMAGGHGDGPGEMLMPMYITRLSDGSILVADASKAAMLLYDHDLQFLDERRGWLGMVPMDIVGTDSTDYIGMFLGFDRSADSPRIERQIGRFGTGDVPDRVYLSGDMQLDISSSEQLYRDVLFWYLFTADGDGNVFFAPWSTEEWHVTGMNRAGEVIFCETLDLPMVRKTDAEISDEKLYMETWAARTDEGEIIDWNPDPFRYMITGMGVDGEGRLWVQRGTGFQPLLDVFDIESGEHLFTAAVDGYDSHGWVFTVDSQGILAYREDADSDQKVYILSL